jgi:hypothetical protein
MNRENRLDLILQEGEELRFPVDEGHPLFGAQEVKPIESLVDIIDFEFVRLWAHYSGVQIYPDEIISVFEEEAPEDTRRARLLARRLRTEDAFVRFMGEFYKDVFKLKLADFIVPMGSTVELTNNMNQILASRVIVTGTLRSLGQLTINADELGG